MPKEAKIASVGAAWSSFPVIQGLIIRIGSWGIVWYNIHIVYLDVDVTAIRWVVLVQLIL